MGPIRVEPTPEKIAAEDELAVNIAGIAPEAWREFVRRRLPAEKSTAGDRLEALLGGTQS